MAKVERVAAVIQALERNARKYESKSVTVGYTQSYAVPVHENLDVFHKVGQAKYLEQPARELQDDIGDIIVKAIKRGVSVLQSLILGGLFLQRESQKLVPVDTGALKNSAFTAETEE